MTQIYSLNEKQIKKVNKLIGDSRARWIEFPEDDYKDNVKVLQHDGQKIGEITIPDAFKLADVK